YMSAVWYNTLETDEIENLRWMGGNVGAAQALTINNNIRSVQILGLNYKRTDASTTMWALQSGGYTGTAIIKNNLINGKPAVNYPYDVQGTVYVTGSQYTVHDTVGFVFKNRALTNNEVTLPPISNPLNFRRTIGVKNIGSAPLAIKG